MLRLNYLENAHLVLDIGLTYTKCGFAKDSMPMHIFQTPLSFVQALHNQAEQSIYTYQVPQHNSSAIRENLSKLNTTTFVDALRLNTDRLHNEVEEFLTTLFYHVLKTNPKDKSIILCEKLGGMRKLTQAIGYVLFKKFQVKNIYSLLMNALPLYTTGLETGITVDCGFQHVEILPFAMSQICVEAFEVCYAGGVHIERNLSQMIRDDNQRLLQKLIQQLPQYQNDLPSRIIEDVKVRCLFTMQVPQKKEYYGDLSEVTMVQGKMTPEKVAAINDEEVRAKANLDKMKKKMTSFGKQHREFPSMQISLHTRAKTMEVCFGNPEKEEANIAASILRSVLKLNLNVRVLACQNIIVSGGSCMVPGFKIRLMQEMKYLVENFKEFKELETIVKYFKLADCAFPPNCLPWVGASLVASMNTEAERFMTTLEEFEQNDNKLPDRFGDAYLHAFRDEPYLNADQEYKNQFAKQSLYSSMTPISARSYQEKKMTINQQLERTLHQMKTPTASQLAGGHTPSSSLGGFKARDSIMSSVSSVSGIHGRASTISMTPTALLDKYKKQL